MSSKLRVVIVNNFSGPSVGRYGLRALPLVKGLLASGARVAVVAAAGSGFAHAAIDAGADVTAISMSRFRAPAIVHAIKDAAWRINANVISGTGYFTNLLVRQAAPANVKVVNTAARMPNVPVEFFGGNVEVTFRDLIDTVKRDRSDAYVAISQAVADALVRHGVPKDIITVIPNGIDADAFKEASTDLTGDGAGKIPVSTVKEKRRPLIFCAARNMDSSKGIDVLAEAAAHMLHTWPSDAPVLKPHFFVAGSGPEKNVLRDYAKGEGIEHDFQIVGYAPLIAPWYAACDITVMSSRAEAAAVVALEAMSLDKPVIASNVGGIPEVVIDGETGILVEPDDSAALADAIRDLVTDPQRAHAMGEAGGKRVRELFTERQMVDSYIELFKKLTEGQS
ncbi:MAG: glycosyltransferase family 4 protein [Coriobacteriia bacterium]|nr:glycosyltransferase family 4 protein [Coriobacteriia bacterium]